MRMQPGLRSVSKHTLMQSIRQTETPFAQCRRLAHLISTRVRETHIQLTQCLLWNAQMPVAQCKMHSRRRRDAGNVGSLGSRLDSTHRGRPDHADLAHLGFLEASKLQAPLKEEEPKRLISATAALRPSFVSPSCLDQQSCLLFWNALERRWAARFPVDSEGPGDPCKGSKAQSKGSGSWGHSDCPSAVPKPNFGRYKQRLDVKLAASAGGNGSSESDCW